MEKVKKPVSGFVEFVREQGVVGLAVGLVIGTAIKSMVDSLVNNIINPVIGLLTGGVNLADKYVCLKKVGGACSNKLAYGPFISSVISFITIAAVIYFVVMGLKLHKLDKKKDEAKKEEPKPNKK